jgi:hypothetical protein
VNQSVTLTFDGDLAALSIEDQRDVCDQIGDLVARSGVVSSSDIGTCTLSDGSIVATIVFNEDVTEEEAAAVERALLAAPFTITVGSGITLFLVTTVSPAPDTTPFLTTVAPVTAVPTTAGPTTSMATTNAPVTSPSPTTTAVDATKPPTASADGTGGSNTELVAQNNNEASRSGQGTSVSNAVVGSVAVALVIAVMVVVVMAMRQRRCPLTESSETRNAYVSPITMRAASLSSSPPAVGAQHRSVPAGMLFTKQSRLSLMDKDDGSAAFGSAPPSYVNSDWDELEWVEMERVTQV